MSVIKTVQDVTDRIAARSAQSRGEYLDRIEGQRAAGVYRSALACGNLAHAFAAAMFSQLFQMGCQSDLQRYPEPVHCRFCYLASSRSARLRRAMTSRAAAICVSKSAS